MLAERDKRADNGFRPSGILKECCSPDFESDPTHLVEVPGFAALSRGGIEVSVPVRKSQKKFRSGELAPITGIYVVSHGLRHREPHEVVIIRGEILPACRTCKLNTQFEIVKVISHVTHDWDFSGPNNLTIRPHHEQFADFRVFRRVNVRLPVTFRIPPYSKPVQFHGYSSDLSAGGLGAIIRDKLPSAYKTALIKIDVGTGAAPLSIHGRFRHQSGVRYGFEFADVAGAQTEVIRRMIQKHMKAASSVG